MKAIKRWAAPRGFYVSREKYPDTDDYWVLSVRWIYVIVWKDRHSLRPIFHKTTMRWYRFDVELVLHPQEIWIDLGGRSCT